MPRTTRRRSATDIYHVMIRGVDRMDIFRDAQDRQVFLRYLKQDLLGGSGGKLFAWCLMDNHVHLLMQLDLPVLSTCMQVLDGRYAIYFNSKYGRTGHLFEERFKSENVEDDAYFLTVVRYIHQNPVKAFMTCDCRYRWSSFGEYLTEPSLCDTGFVLGMFEGVDNFLAFHATVAFEDRCLEMKLALSDEEAARYAAKVVGADKLASLKHLDKDERDSVFRILRSCMFPAVQIARITGYEKSTVYRA